MKKKIVTILALLCFLMASFLGCTKAVDASASLPTESSLPSQATQENIEESAQEGAQSIPKSVQKELSSGVAVNAQVKILPDVLPATLPSIKASLCRFNAEDVKRVLLNEAKIAQETEVETKDSVFEDASLHTYVTSDGQILSVGEEHLTYCTSDWNYEDTMYFSPSPTSQDYNGNAFQKGKELDFAKPNACFDELKTVLQELGITVAGLFDCFVLDSETLAAEAEMAVNKRADALEGIRKDSVGNLLSREEILEELSMPVFSSSRDCYYFQLSLSVAGNPITREDSGSSFSGGYAAGSVINAAYSQKGLVYLEIRNLYSGEEMGKEQACLNLDQALEALDNKYNSLILAGEYEVTEICFEYVPIGTGDLIHVTLTPAWRFLVNHTIEYTGKEDPSQVVEVNTNKFVFFNGLTGKEIVVDMGEI